MKHLRFFSVLITLWIGVHIYAQQAIISPVPQSIVWGLKAFDNSVTYQLKGEASADVDAVALLTSSLKLAAAGVELIVGERGDALVAGVAAEIPAVREGYYLSVSPDRVIVAGNDSVGTYYGVQTLLQVLSMPEVMSVVIKDYPDVIERGVVEGFYGNPFSQADRIRQFEFYGKNKMNAYIYGPKDDPYHGFSNRWRDPYPAADAQRIKELIVKAHENKVNFVWAVHPGNDIKWTDNNGDGVIDDFKACVNKFELMYQLGVRSFAVFFDDIGGVGTDPVNQAKMMNYLNAEFVQKKPDVQPLILCPTQYNQAWSSGDYLSILGTQMDKSVRIMWTGKSVVRMIDKETMDWINSRIQRNAYIWLNYPVTDYVIDHLLMGPVVGNSTAIAQQLSGFTANPMEYAEASKVALYSIADYAWNMKKFNPQTSWINAMKHILPENFDAFKVFNENNIDLGPTGHGLRMSGESLPFKAVADPLMVTVKKGEYNAAQCELVKAQFRSFRSAAAELKSSTYNTALISELTPWLTVFDMMGEKGELLLAMYSYLHSGDSVAFINAYLSVDSLDNAQKAVRSRNFPGSIKSPNPKPANEVVAPWIKQLKSILVAEYRRKFDYRESIFPKILLDEGRYYIKVNGRYLTNQNVNGSGGNPVFVANRDTINPQRQEWTFSMDPVTERYKIVNTQDGRYINELGSFGVNVYEAVWHTYNILRLNGRYAIQNAGSAGDKFWYMNVNRISPSTRNVLKASEFVFEIVPVGNENPAHPVISPDETFYIKYGDGYLSNTNVAGNGGFPVFKTLSAVKTASQQWRLTIDPATDRFKLVSAVDNRYVNELGAFGTNTYLASWNTYTFTELGGLFSIQNAGDAGSKFWTVSSGRFTTGNDGRNDSYLFELIPSSKMYVTSEKAIKKKCFLKKKKTKLK
jgi:hyaluronoglucosaminidase